MLKSEALGNLKNVYTRYGTEILRAYRTASMTNAVKKLKTLQVIKTKFKSVSNCK
jgi:hypothetical protein